MDIEFPIIDPRDLSRMIFLYWLEAVGVLVFAMIVEAFAARKRLFPNFAMVYALTIWILSRIVLHIALGFQPGLAVQTDESIELLLSIQNITIGVLAAFLVALIFVAIASVLPFRKGESGLLFASIRFLPVLILGCLVMQEFHRTTMTPAWFAQSIYKDTAALNEWRSIFDPEIVEAAAEALRDSLPDGTGAIYVQFVRHRDSPIVQLPGSEVVRRMQESGFHTIPPGDYGFFPWSGGDNEVLLTIFSADSLETGEFRISMRVSHGKELRWSDPLHEVLIVPDSDGGFRAEIYKP